jgi:hypothetical protein
VLEILLFVASLLLHLSVLVIGPNEAYTKYGQSVFRGTVNVGVPITAFVSGTWRDQIETCPRWMWKGALVLGAYVLLMTCAQMLLSVNVFSEEARMISGFPLPFDAISLCILHSVLWSDYLDKSEVVRRAGYSAAVATFGLILFLAYGAGYLHPPKNNVIHA